MFEKIFSYPAVLRRHREGPLASERLEYLQYLSDRGAALGTLLRQARYCLCIAREIQRWPREHCFDAAELEAIAASWAARRVAQGRAAAPRWPKETVLLRRLQLFGTAWPLGTRSSSAARPLRCVARRFPRGGVPGTGIGPGNAQEPTVAHPALPHLSGPTGIFPRTPHSRSRRRLSQAPRPNVESRFLEFDRARLANLVSVLRDHGKDTGGIGRLHSRSSDLPARGTPLRTDVGAGQRHHS